MKKKILSILLVAIMVFSLLPTMALAAEYTDTQGHWGEASIDRWSGYGVVNGKGNEVFDPDGQMTRAEAAQVFANLFGLNKEGDISGFTDVKDDWYTSAIAKCYAAGILSGKGDGKMDPDGTITREEFLTMYARAVCISNGTDVAEAKSGLEQKGFTDTAKVADWAADAIGTLVDKGYVSGISATEIAPQANINRASVMALLDQSISTYVGKNSTETTVAAKSEGITLIANPAVTTVTGTADVVVVAAGAEKFDEETGEFEHNDIRVESAKMPVARVQGENITVTLALSTTADDATVTETGVDSIIVIESTSEVKNAAVAAEGAKIIVKDGGKAESVTVAETAKSASVETEKDATVGTVTIAAEDVKTTVAGKVETVKVEETAKNATVETKETAKVETVENKAENTAVTGTGSVSEVKSSEDVKIETKNTKVENTSETKEIAVTDNKGAETKVETKTEGGETKPETVVNEQETPPTGGGGGGGHSHSYTWTTVTPATCIEDGEKEGTCTCGDTKTEIIPKLGHDFVEGVCTRCGAKKFEIHNAEELRDFVSNNTDTSNTYNYGFIADDFDVEGTVFCTRNSDFTIDFNGKTVNFESEYTGKNEKFGAFSIEGEKTITLTDSSLEKTGKFVNTATTGSGNVYLVGIYSSNGSSVIIDGLNIEMTSTSSTSGQIYGVVCSKTSGQSSDNITVKNSKITLNASTGSTVGAFIYGDYCNTIIVDNCEINSTGSGKMIRTGSSSVANISNSKFDVKTDSDSYNSITALDISGANTAIDNVEITAEGYVSSAISVKNNAKVTNSKITVASGTKGEPKGIYVTGNEGATIDNCTVSVSSLTDSESYTAKGIVLSSADNVVIKNCNITAKNLGRTTNLPKSIYFNSTTPKNRVEDSFCTGEVYGVNVISGHYSSDPIDWVLNGYTTSKENNWYVIKEAGANDYVCTITYKEDSQTVTEKFVTLSAAVRRTSELKEKDDLTLTIKKDCELSLSLSIYSNVVINEGVNVNLSAGSLANIDAGTITNNGTLNCPSSLTISKNWTLINNGNASFKTLTINAGTADINGNKTAEPGKLTNYGSIIISSKATLSTLSGYASSKTDEPTKEQLKPVFENNGSLVGVDYSSTLAANYDITGTNPYLSETYKWIGGCWTIGGAVKNITKDKYYDSLSTAISEANENNELKLFADFQPSSYEITNNLTIDLNGHKVEFTNYSNVSGKAKAFTIDDATLTIDDTSENHNGKIIATAGAAIWIKDNSSLVLNNGIIENTGRGGTYSCVILIAGYESGHEVGATNASLVVNGGKIIASSEEWTDPTTNIYYFPGDGIYIYGHGDASNAPSITMTAGVISANGTAISGQGSYDYADINISGGTVTSSGSCAMYLPQKGTTNITGGTITGETGICIKGGTLNISDGTITGVGEKFVPSNALGSGTNLTGDAIYVEDNYTQRAIYVSITGGTLTSTNGYQIQRLFPVADEGYETEITITNETIVSTNGIN